jgi:hypothetical protein
MGRVLLHEKSTYTVTGYLGLVFYLFIYSDEDPYEDSCNISAD